MKQIINLLAVVFISAFSYSCSDSKAENTVQAPSPKKYIILVDLSDRLLQPNQASKDIAVFNSVFDAFMRAVEDNLLIKSNDKFITRILYQRNSTLDFESYSDSLSLDLSNYRLGAKKEQIIRFRNAYKGILERLYDKARLGQNSKSFDGVDIWKYFNEQMKNDIDNSCSNTVIILTDGYFDFNDMSHMHQQGGYYTTTAFLSKLNNQRWRTEAEHTGLIPVKLPKNVKWMVCGINSKHPNDQLMNEKLSFFWKKWLEQSTGERVSDPIISSTPQTMGNLIKNMINY
jgi:hypothetical protein